MKRLVDYHLRMWRENQRRKPLLLRGARQVGKTHAVRTLAQSFVNFVEINFELEPTAASLFERDLKPDRLVRDLSLLTGVPIKPGETLLFFDEVQAAPKALSAMRYFYELMPELHVVAAGSLLDFTIEKIGLPVGRIASLYLYPLSFVEFLVAKKESYLVAEIAQHAPEKTMTTAIHDKALNLVAEYLAIGGMPEALQAYLDTGRIEESVLVHQQLIDGYRQDFHKYAAHHQIKYLDLLFDHMPRVMGKHFKYNELPGDHRKRELAPCVQLLRTAGVLHAVLRNTGGGVPLGAHADADRFKIVFLDVALAQSLLDLDVKDWLLYPQKQLANAGAIGEAFVGQEMLAYCDPSRRAQLYYWQRDQRGSQAEVDYLYQSRASALPVEVKSGKGTTLKSLHMFLQSYPQVPYGLRFSMHNYSVHEKVVSYPLYALVHCLRYDGQPELDDLLS